MPSNLKSKRKGSILRVAIAKRVAVLRNIVNAIKVEFLAQDCVLVKGAKIVMIMFKGFKSKNY